MCIFYASSKLKSVLAQDPGGCRDNYKKLTKLFLIVALADTILPDREVQEEQMVDKAKIEQAIRLYLEGIGEDVNREGLLDTPNRIARMCEEIYGGMDEDAGVHLAKQFSVTSNEMVIEKDITFYSMCEHHLMPFYGKAHIAYIPQGKVVGLSKLARTVEVFARRAQIQEKLTAQIADALEEHLNPAGVMIMLEAEHMCMTMRGIRNRAVRR